MRRKEQGHMLNLDDAASVWKRMGDSTGPRPARREARLGTGCENESQGPRRDTNLNEQAMLVGWATPQATRCQVAQELGTKGGSIHDRCRAIWK